MIGSTKVCRDGAMTCRRELEIVLFCEVLRGVANLDGEVVGARLGNAIPEWKGHLLAHVQAFNLVVEQGNIYVSFLRRCRVLELCEHSHPNVCKRKSCRVVHYGKSSTKLFPHQDLSEATTEAQHLITADIFIRHIVFVESLFRTIYACRSRIK